MIADLLEDQIRQETAQKNTNNNRTHNTSTNKNREFKSILNLADLQRKYGPTANLKPNTDPDQSASTDSTNTHSVRAESVHNFGQKLKSSMPKNQFVNLSSPYLVSGSRAGIIAVQHFNNGVPVVRYARVNPTTQARIMNQCQKRRINPQVRFLETTTKIPGQMNNASGNLNDSDASTDKNSNEETQNLTEKEATHDSK